MLVLLLVMHVVHRVWESGCVRYSTKSNYIFIIQAPGSRFTSCGVSTRSSQFLEFFIILHASCLLKKASAAAGVQVEDEMRSASKPALSCTAAAIT